MYLYDGRDKRGPPDWDKRLARWARQYWDNGRLSPFLRESEVRGLTRLVSLDFETTGPVQGWENEPWQLGCVEIVEGEPVASSCWETYFRIPADRPFSPRAPGRWAQLRGELAAAPSFADLWPDLAARFQGVPLVAHNAATERIVLVKRAPLAPFGPWFDTLRLVRRFWPTLKSYTLGDLVRTFGLQARVDALCPDRTWHDALYDACAGAVLFSHVLHVAGWDVVSGESIPPKVSACPRLGTLI